MACSDNVIRGGLTPKYVDIVELLKLWIVVSDTSNYLSRTSQSVRIYL